MPYKTIYVQPELFLSHNNVNVYHCYKHDNIEDSIDNYTYTLNPEQDSQEDKFDIRELDVPEKEQLDAQPPFIGASNPEWVNADPVARQVMVGKWREWHDDGFPKAVKAVMTSAIDRGLLKN